MKSRFPFLCILCFFAACQTELPLPDASGAHKITLVGELTANDSVQLRVGQSMSFGAGATPELLRGVAMSINDGAIVTPLQEGDDYLSSSLFTLPFTSPAIITEGRNYTVSARHPELGEVTAAVAIPKAFSASLTGAMLITYNNDSVMRVDIALNDVNAGSANYVVDVVKQPGNTEGYFTYDFNTYLIADNQALYDSLHGAGVPLSEFYDTTFSDDFFRQEFYINDVLADNGGTTGSNKFTRLYLMGKRFGSATHQTQLLIPRKPLFGEPGQFAKTVISVKSVAADYYTYLKAYDAYRIGAEPGSNNIPARLPGNVRGGYGMIGGMYRRQFALLY